MTSATTAAALTTDTGPIVARGASYYRNMRYIMTAGLILTGAWFAYDGWVRYPRHNEEARALKASKMPHSERDLLMQRGIAVLLPPLGLALLCWTLYNSRGAYRYEADTLKVPGHPPVTLDAIRQIDKTKWDRKGIAYIDYETPGRSGRLKLDDFVYEQQPTQDILKAIESKLVAEAHAVDERVADPASGGGAT